MNGYTLDQIAGLVKGTVSGDGSTVVTGVTGIEAPQAGFIAFVDSKKRLREAENSPFAALIAPTGSESQKKPLLLTDHPKVVWALLMGQFYPARSFQEGISQQAVISKTAKIGKHVTIEPFCTIGERVEVGDHCVIRSHVYLDDDVRIGEHSVIHPQTTIYPKTEIGNHVCIHSGCTIGSDGFGYVFDGQKQAKIPQIGKVVIEDWVEIGASCTIDRAAVGVTKIGKGVKIDNLVQVAHNVEVGAHTCLSAQVGISGSSKIGSYVTMGGRAGIGDHCEVGDQVMLGAQTGLPTGKKIPAKQIWFGAPARPYKEMRRQVGAQLRSYETQKLIRELQKRIETLESELNSLKTTQT